MHRFYAAPQEGQGDHLTLRGSEAHHALHVLRLQRGAQVIVLDGCGRERLCEVTLATRESISLRTLEERNLSPLPCEITLVQALPKGKLFESIVQKATELGVFRIVPLLTERVITHLDPHDAAARTAKWQGIAIEAIKQCGSGWLPKVESPILIGKLLEQGLQDELTLVGALQGAAEHPRKHWLAYRHRHGRAPRRVSVWIGPEGDFTPAELHSLTSAGALPITLGPLVLRTETAATYCLSVLSYELQAESPTNAAS